MKNRENGEGAALALPPGREPVRGLPARFSLKTIPREGFPGAQSPRTPAVGGRCVTWRKSNLLLSVG